MPISVRDARLSEPDRLWIEGVYRDYLDDINIQQVNPQPDSVELDQDKVTYSYQVKQLNQPATIIFYFNPDRIGPINGKVGLENEPLLSFSQFIYP